MGSIFDEAPPGADQPLLAASHYYWGCCMLCHKAGTPENPLKRCSRCHCMFYCSAQHQRAHWKTHRKLCNYLCSAAEEIGADNFFGKGQEDEEDDPAKRWKIFRMNAIRTAEILTGRTMEEWEKEMFLFPRACRLCHTAKRAGMLDCPECMGVTYCSEQHRDEDRETHEAICHELKFAMVCDNFESSVSVAAPPLPSEIDSEFRLVDGDVLDFLADPSQGRLLAEGTHPLKEMEQRFLTDRLSGPLSVLFAASKTISDLDHLTEFTLHLVGANIIEMLGIIKWEYILHRLPRCSSLRIVFIGLELDQEEEGECDGLGACPDCSDQGRRVVYEMRCKSYQAYCLSGDYKVPNLVAALNCGFHEHENEPEKETWRDSLPFLVRRANVPLLFTSYTLTEAEKDLKLIQGTEEDLKIVAERTRNPFRSHRPIRDFECDNNKDVFYNNQYFSLVKRT